MKLKIEIENWNWKLKLKIEIENWNWKLKLKTEIENFSFQFYLVSGQKVFKKKAILRAFEYLSSFYLCVKKGFCSM